MAANQLSSVSIAVVVHLYYLDLWPEMSEALSRLPAATAIFITTPTHQTAAVEECVHTKFPSAHVYGFPNRGRDIGPLLELLKIQRLEDYDLVLKMHTKKSLHLRMAEKDLGQFWRKNLITQLVPAWGIDDIVSHFAGMPHVGMAGPAEYLMQVGASMQSEGTSRLFQALLKRVHTDADPALEQFFAGTMFWARGKVFAALRSLGLQQSDIEEERGQVDGTLAHALERLFPLLVRSLNMRLGAFPMWDFRPWLKMRVPSPPQAKLIRQYLARHGGGPRILMAIVDSYGNKPDLLERTLQSLQAAMTWGLNVEALVVSDAPALWSALGRNNPEWFFVVDVGDELTASGLLMVVQKILQNPDARAVYADEMKAQVNGKLEAVLRPDFNLDLLLSCPGFMSRHWLFNVSAIVQAGGSGHGDGAWLELDYILRLIEKHGVGGIFHVAEPLLTAYKSEEVGEGPEAVILKHLHARNYPEARVTSVSSDVYRIEYGYEQQAMVSILIEVCDELQSLTRCIESLLSKTTYFHYEIIVADNFSQSPETIAWLEKVPQWGGVRVRVVRMPSKISHAEIYNRAAKIARGEYLLTLSHEASITDGGWLKTMLNYAHRPEVGVVGPLLTHPRRWLSHAGFVLGLRSVVSRPFTINSKNGTEKSIRYRADQNYSALPDACFLIKRSVFEELGGFDERAFSEFYADSDLCLKALTAGYINVWTPHAQVTYEGDVHHESISEKSPIALQKIHDEQRENFYRKWIDLISADPAYNPNYALVEEGYTVLDDREMFSIKAASRWSPLNWRPVPVVLAHPIDRQGCGHYRVMQPFMALRNAALVDGQIVHSASMSIEAARLKPDVLVAQRLTSEHSISEYRRMKARKDFFMIIDFDDYLPGVPLKNINHKYFSDKQIIKKIKEGLSLADRLIVSTPGLAENFEKYHRNMRISELKLPPEWWGNLKSGRSDGPKPRVGWAGGNSHTGDLELMTDVVKALAGEVDWVFMGMCPESLKPWVKEFHTGVMIDLYPEKLASLNLDLAIAPLENNVFNDCKSNLRLLEYGACAYPVVCSNARAYRESGLPVTVVKNRFKDWVAAIRMHINDLDETHRSGEALRQAVLSNWMLSDQALIQWRANWCPD